MSIRKLVSLKISLLDSTSKSSSLLWPRILHYRNFLESIPLKRAHRISDSDVSRPSPSGKTKHSYSCLLLIAKNQWHDLQPVSQISVGLKSFFT